MDDCARWISELGHPRLLVLGDLMIDRYVWGDAERVSPEAPVLVLREDLDEVRPGGAANVASFVRALEADVVLAGIIGADAEGRALCRLVDELKIDASGLVVDERRPTTCKRRFVGRTAQKQPQQILRVDRESSVPISEEIRLRLLEVVWANLASCQAVLISDYGKGVCSPELLRAVIDEARRRNLPVLIDPSRGGDYRRYARATLLTPNRVATELVLGTPLRSAESFTAAAQQFRQQLDLDAAVLTLDRDGLAYATEHEHNVVPCRPREVCDVTGAGDMALAVLGLCSASGIPLHHSLRMANAAAGLEVERFGVEPVTRGEIVQELNRNVEQARSPLSLDELLDRVARHRRNGKSIVFTNGCFDLLHVGHVSLLEEAARLGDVLIVAINSDASVRKLKGSERPIIAEHDRARMLAALACVDHVVIFDDETPHRLLEAIRPDVLVKGGTTGHIVGREIVEAYGGTVSRTSCIPGVSTTSLLALAGISQSGTA